jgi:transcriptional regulator
MYIPSISRTTPGARAFIDGTRSALVTTADGRPFATHIPFYDATAALHGHVARQPEWTHAAAAAEVLVFQGPHGYVSPTWYEDPGVPT